VRVGGTRYVRTVFWFSRPPYGKYAAAVVLLTIGVYAEFRPSETRAHPFAVDHIVAGAPLESSLFEERPVLKGSLAAVAIAGRAAHDIEAGEPLLASAVDTQQAATPDGWWALEVPLPASASAGMAVRLVVHATDSAGSAAVVEGVVIEPTTGTTDPLGFESPNGLVAVPEPDAAAAAVAVADRRVTVLLTP